MSLPDWLKDGRRIIDAELKFSNRPTVLGGVKTAVVLVLLFTHLGALPQSTSDSDIPSPANAILRNGADSTRIGDDGTTRLLGKTIFVGAYRIRAISTAIANAPKDAKTKLTCEKLAVDTALYMSMDYKLRDHGHTRTTIACHLEFNASQPRSSPITRFVFVETGDREIYMLSVGQRVEDR